MKAEPSRHALFLLAEVSALDFQRYVIRDFLCGSPVLVDRLEKSLCFYRGNLYGQIYNLNNPERHVFGTAKINGLIRRTNGSNYNFTNSFAIDGYIYAYLMSPEQQAKCGRTPDIPAWNTLIAQTDDYAGAVKSMCEWVYDNHYPPALGDKEARRGELLQYCDRFLSGRQDAPPTREPAAQPRGHDDR